MQRAASNLSPNDYAAAVARNPTYGMLVPAGTSGASASQATPTSGASTPQAAPASGASASQAAPATSSSENAARNQLRQIASEPGNSALKMRLAQEGVSLTDESDVGPGKRFDSFTDKLFYVLDLRAALVIAMAMSMASSGGAGPSNTEDVASAREALRGA